MKEMREMGRQALEKREGRKSYNTERELTAVTAELYISGAVFIILFIYLFIVFG